MRMDQPASWNLERYTRYLPFLAQVHLDPRLRGKFDASDLVQQTLLDAHQHRDEFRGETEAQWMAWLRQILARNLADALRAFTQAKRDVALERSIEDDLGASSARLGSWLAADQSSPSAPVVRDEQAVRLADALATLPEAQREALLLRYWHGWSLEQIAQHMERSYEAVAGLLKRGLHELRNQLQNLE
jgi:RNA polymerase sigma-70 factor (ECF subfamily)